MARTKNTKLHIYCAEGDPDYGCQYVAALTSKEAKQLAMGCDITGHLDNPYIELRVTLCRSVKQEKIDKYIKGKGLLNIFDINNVGLTWWDCPECENEEFEILDDGYHYRCKNCNKEFEIPYVC